MFFKKNTKGNIVKYIPGTPATEVTEDGIQATIGENGLDNWVINGGMEFAQRIGTSEYTIPSAGSTGYWALDRWHHWHNCTDARVSRQAHGDSSLSSRYCMRVKMQTLGGGSVINIAQSFEYDNLRPLAGRTVTLSFLARKSASLASGGISASGMYKTSEAGAYTLTRVDGVFVPGSLLTITNGELSTSFKRFSKTFLIPSTALAFAPLLQFTNSPTDGQYVEIAEVTLNPGTRAAPFKRAGGTISGELALCQRYYEVLAVWGRADGTSSLITDFNYRVPKRITTIVPTHAATQGGGAVGTVWRVGVGSVSTAANGLIVPTVNGSYGLPFPATLVSGDFYTLEAYVDGEL